MVAKDSAFAESEAGSSAQVVLAFELEAVYVTKGGCPVLAFVVVAL
jgi:hypothetical protein